MRDTQLFDEVACEVLDAVTALALEQVKKNTITCEMVWLASLAHKGFKKTLLEAAENIKVNLDYKKLVSDMEYAVSLDASGEHDFESGDDADLVSDNYLQVVFQACAIIYQEERRKTSIVDMLYFSAICNYDIKLMLEDAGVTNLPALFAAMYDVLGINPISSMAESEEYGSAIDDLMNGMGGDINYESFCTDLRELVSDDEKIIGREDEIDKTLRVLCRKEKANPMHIGEPGVGKTAIVRRIAQMLNHDEVPEKLKGYQLFSLDIGGVLAGAAFRGDVENRLRTIITDLDSIGDVILYIDEIHMINATNGGVSIADILKKALVESSIKFIGATTYEEYRSHIEKDKALARRFKPVYIKEPSKDDCFEILRGIKKGYEVCHGVEYLDSALDACITLSTKHIHDKYLPDKAIDLMDEAGAILSKDGKGGVVDTKLIERVVSETVGIPLDTVQIDEGKKLLGLEDELKKRVFGQDETIHEICRAIKLSRSGLSVDDKPTASVLLVGQTGVGKTEIAKQLANIMGVKFLRYDMSEYMDETAVNKLVGSNAGYVGYENGGLLVEDVRKNPYAVLLLDEIEKAHPKVFDCFLQVMDNATLKDNKGRLADFRNVIILMTSNCGASGVLTKSMGFGGGESVDLSVIDKAVEKTFSPEFRNRLTCVCRMNSMSDQMAKSIVEKQLDDFKTLLFAKDIVLEYNTSLVEYIKEKGITKEFGARNILRVIDKDIKDLLVDESLLGNLRGKVKLAIKDNAVVRV